MQLSLLRLAVLATVWGVPVAAQAQFSWTTNNGTLTITAYTGPGGAVTIPASTNGLPVTGIGYEAFLGCTGLTGITIPDSVTNLGDYAFAFCPGLTNVAMPGGLAAIGGAAFEYCTGLTGVAIPDSVTTVGDSAFAYCSALANLAMPGGVTTIGDSAFAYCRSLANVALPASVTSLGDSAFAYCRGLTNVAMPGGLISIGDSAFARCSGLVSVAIPDGLTSVGGSAFAYCTGLTNVAIGNSVTNVGAGAFYLCTNLSAISVDALNPFYSSAGGVLFNQGRTTLVCCPEAEAGTYTVPGGVTNIAESAFAGCARLVAVALPNTLASIGNDAFYGCSSLATVTIPGSVTSLGSYAFASNSILGSIYFQGNAPTANSTVFAADDPSLTVFHLLETAGWSTVFARFPAVIWDPLSQLRFTATNGAITITGYGGLGGALTIPASIDGLPVAGIGRSAFGGCSNLASVAMGSSVTSIGDSAFYQCSGLTNVTLGNSLTNMGQYAFAFCTALTNVTIPSTLSAIGTYAFGSCSNLASVAMGSSVTSIGDSAFYQCGGLTNVTMGNSLTNIGQYAFALCTALTSVTIPSTLSAIGMYAFGGCSSLASVTLPDGVTNIAELTFARCSSLSSVTLGNAVSSIGESAFADCSRLAGITIPNSVTGIGTAAFDGCASLASVTVPGEVTSIADLTFANCSSLGSVTVGNGVSSIGASAFADCSSLTGVYFQGNAASLSEGAFDDYHTTLYYLPCSSGWSVRFGFPPAVELNWVAFTASPTYATYVQLPLTVNFTSPDVDNCGEKITGWHWSFGDGSTSTAQNPTHTYTTNGTFAPSLRATTSAGVQVFGEGPPITVSQPSVAFTANPTDGTVPLTVSFASAGVDNGGNAVTNWNWSFGDGSTSTAQNPSHTYASKGAFSPVLIAANNLGDAVTGSGPASIVALWGGSTVGFTLVPTDGTVPATVSFASAGVDSRGNAITNWNWGFGDGSTSTAQNPTHTYTSTGDFAPSLLATNNAGVLVVGVGPSVRVFWPSVAWTINPTFGTVPLTVSFTSAGFDNRGNAVTNWNWSFGDGSSSTAQNPTHTYTTAGHFDPALTATNNLGVMVIAGLGSVEVLPAGNVGFTANPTNGVAPLTVSFTSGGLDSNGNAVTNWNWSFGDGSTSTAQNPSHLYNRSGTFSIALIATNNLGGTITGSGPASITATNAPPPPNLVTNGGFETGDFTGWTRSGADLGDNFVDDGSSSEILPHSGRYLAALGSAGAPSYLSQTLSTVAGVFYSLSLWLDSPEDGQGPNELLVSWNGSTLLDEMNIPAVGWTNLQFLASATGATTVLEFGIRDDFTYLGLDDISVSPAPAPVPVGFANVGVQTNRFGFVITGTSNLAVVVEASTKLANPAWHPVQTNTLTGGSFYFSDPGWTNYPSRFYRVRGP